MKFRINLQTQREESVPRLFWGDMRRRLPNIQGADSATPSIPKIQFPPGAFKAIP
jgi:hypothetical protein